MKNWKKILCGVIAGMMIAAAPVQAAVLDTEVKATIETNDIPPWPKASDIMAEAGLLMEYSTGTVIFSKGADQRIAPSGTAKLMTLLLAAENSNLEDQVTVTETGMRDLNPDAGAMALQLGETLTMKHCLQLMLLASSNQAAAQIAEKVGGTESQFIQMMNDRAKKLGCDNTNFTNASGLPDPNQYTTAGDLAKIYRAGLKNKNFNKIMRLKKASIPPTNLTGTERVVGSIHPIMSKYSSIFDKDCTGGNYGQSEEVGCNLVTSVRKNGVTYIAVVMKDVDLNQAGVDSQYLLKYAYENFQRVAVPGGNVVIPNGSSVADLKITEREANGKVRQFYSMADHRVGRGEKAAEAPTVADPAAQSEDGVVEAQSEGEVQENISPVEEAKLKGLSQTARILLMVMAGMAVVLLILIILLAIKDFRDVRRYDEDDK